MAKPMDRIRDLAGMRHRALLSADALTALLEAAHPLAQGGCASWRAEPSPEAPTPGEMASDVARWVGNLRSRCAELNAEVSALEARGARVKVGELTAEAFAARMTASGDCPFTDEALGWIHRAAAAEELDPAALAARYSQLAATEAEKLSDGSVICLLSSEAA